MRKTTRFLITLAATAAALFAQPQPGAGAPLRGLTATEAEFFEKGRQAFQEVDGVADGLGPRFNLDSCAGCHAHPAVGGTSPAVNPQVALATHLGATNRVPPFIQQDGPVRVVRFRRTPNGGPDGGVHNLFTIAGRGDAPPNCNLTQPDFSQRDNIVFRIPTPVFGLGLIEAIPDAVLRANLAAGAARKRSLGITGRFNISANDGTITRFGWKAQNKSLLIFSGEAYNVEIGVTNELFPQEREDDAACAVTPALEDADSDAALFTQFMRWLAPPRPAPPSDASDRGREVFNSIGCDTCHTPLLRTGRHTSLALHQQDVPVYSDLALHRMGQALNDGIDQGDAHGDDWRTAPLWGLGQRIFFLHDGRTRDLADAIRLHDSPGSEARQVIGNFNALTPEQRQDLLTFLRSL